MRPKQSPHNIFGYSSSSRLAIARREAGTLPVGGYFIQGVVEGAMRVLIDRFLTRAAQRGRPDPRESARLSRQLFTRAAQHMNALYLSGTPIESLDTLAVAGLLESVAMLEPQIPGLLASLQSQLRVHRDRLVARPHSATSRASAEQADAPQAPAGPTIQAGLHNDAIVRTEAGPTVNGTGETPQFPNRASWLRERLRERSWNKHDLSRQRGPDCKTVQKILDGQRVREDVLEKLATALSKAPDSKRLPKVTLLDIPEN